MTKGQQEFLDQMTRKKLVEWCAIQVTTEKAEDWEDNHPVTLNYPEVYLRYATQKKWISTLLGKESGPFKFKILATGWETAARFLKR